MREFLLSGASRIVFNADTGAGSGGGASGAAPAGDAGAAAVNGTPAAAPSPAAGAGDAGASAAAGAAAAAGGGEAAKPKLQMDSNLVADAGADGGAAPKEGDGADPKEGDGEAAKPIEYEPFTMPEGIALDEALINDIKPIFSELGLNQDQAQSLVDFYNKNALKPYELFTQTQETWQGEIKAKYADGQIPAEISSGVKSVVDGLGGEALRQALNLTGAGNHPAVWDAFVKLIPMFAEPKSPPAGKPAGKASKTAAATLYGTSDKES